MSSTGEVGCLGKRKEEAVLKALMSVGMKRPEKGLLVSSGDPASKDFLLDALKAFSTTGLPIYATAGTKKHLNKNGVEATLLHWPDETEQPNTMDYLARKEVDLVINIPKNRTKKELGNDFLIRRAAVDYSIPLLTNKELADAFIQSFIQLSNDDLEILSIDEYTKVNA